VIVRLDGVAPTEKLGEGGAAFTTSVTPADCVATPPEPVAEIVRP
jgi:hypothetical protein